MSSEPDQRPADDVLDHSLPPPLQASPASLRSGTIRPSTGRQLLAVLLNIFVWVFLADALITFLGNSLMLFSDISVAMIVPLLVGLLALFLALVVYVLMAFTPAIPKYWFLPLTLFYPLSTLLGIPFAIYHYDHVLWIGWSISATQVLMGAWIFFKLQGSGKLNGVPIHARRLTGRGFSWRNLAGFTLANLFLLLPVMLVYLFFCAGMATTHFTGGFMTLKPGGFTVQAREYVRDDGKTIQLFPMAHVAEAKFYRQISQTFPMDSILLMEGVTDEKNLLTNKITYKRMAKSLGLAEQQEKFKPTRGQMVRGDIDVDQFSTNTIALLNLVMLIHAQGLDANNLSMLLQYSPSQNLQAELFDDLLTKRNQHLLEEITNRLPESQHFVVPWGVAHMPGIAAEIQKSGFHLKAVQEYDVIRFFHGGGQPSVP